MANPFVHIELNTENRKAAKQFYRKIFGWKLADMKMGPGMVYTTIDPEGGTGGGIQDKPMPEAPTQWLPYVQVDSVHKTVAKAARNGAKVYVEYQPIPGMGAFGVFADPQGAVLGIWESAQPPAPAKKKAAKKAVKKKAAKKPAKKAVKKKAAKKKAAKKKAAKKKA